MAIHPYPQGQAGGGWPQSQPHSGRSIHHLRSPPRLGHGGVESASDVRCVCFGFAGVCCDLGCLHCSADVETRAAGGCCCAVNTTDTMPPRLTVSVVIPTLKRAASLRVTLDSLAEDAQTSDLSSVQVVVVCDGEDEG